MAEDGSDDSMMDDTSDDTAMEGSDGELEDETA